MHQAVATELSAHARPLIDDFTEGLVSALATDLIGIYLYGALTFADSASTAADVDYHVLLRRPLGNAQRQKINQLQQRLAQEYPLGRELDGYYLLVDDTRSTAPPTDQLDPRQRDNSWALHRAHILAGHVITLAGPDPSTMYQPPTWAELDAALQGELSYVRDHLEQHPAYGALNLCRLIYSYRHREVVVSKRGTGGWALQELPQGWHRLIDAALRVYALEATPADRRILQSQLDAFLGFAETEIAAAR